MIKKYFIITYGCQMNKSDSKRIATLLEKKGYQQALNEKEADLVVINMCSVREPAVQKVKNQISKIKSINQKSKIILTGCILDIDKKMFEKKEGVMIKQFKNLNKIYPVKNNKVQETEFVPIMQGCNNFCTYCVVPYTKGKEKYRDPKEIICEIKELIKRGTKEIILLGQNVNSYKFKIRNSTQNTKILKKKEVIDFADLLKEINDLEGDFKVRFLTNHPKDMSDKLIETISQCNKIVKHLHLPVQSGDNEILKKMNRGYTKEQYFALVKKIMEKIPQIQLTTDIIVGFPGETKKAFKNTLNLMRKIRFKTAYIAMYSPRPGTTAYKLKDNIPFNEKKRRHQLLLQIIKNQLEKKII